MSGSARCIGGLLEDGTSVRLINPQGQWTAAAPFQIGQVWDIACTPKVGVLAPHTEDVTVHSYKFVGQQAELADHLLQRVNPWRGDCRQFFEGRMAYTQNNNGYLSQSTGVTNYSTGFWIPSQDLILRDDGKHYDYKDIILERFPISRGMAYVGEVPAIGVITAGSLVRLSLARWWKPEDIDDLEERCYLQLSGWF